MSLVGYVDSSCLAAVALGEPGHEEVARILDSFDLLLSSGLLEAEVRSAIQREGMSPEVVDDYIGEVEWVLPGRPLSAEIAEVQQAGLLRGADVWHLAAALFARAGTGPKFEFLTLDTSQRQVAARLGFDTSTLA